MIKSRIIQLIEQKGIAKEKFYLEIGMTSANFRGKAKETPLNSTAIEKIFSIIPDVNIEWLLTGEGPMLKSDGKDIKTDAKRPLIPLYNDVAAIGGVNERVANMEGVQEPSDWIDAGDWFGEATSAIHHYGDSMTEYPSGCILVLRRIFDIPVIVWGKNYVVETDELRLTKRLQRGLKDGYIRAYSSNEDKYDDGTLIHEPMDIPVSSIRRLELVLGYVVKEQSSSKLYNIKSRK
jgi:phage repressor protein C with HTH and peptisase S24 domain